MEGSTSKADAMKPIFLKAGIPLALSVAGFVSARIIANRSRNPEASSRETQVSPPETEFQEDCRDEESIDGLDAVSSTHKEDGEEEQSGETRTHFAELIGSSDIPNRNDLEEEILGLRKRIEELQKREWGLEMQFLSYCDLKEQESVLMELKNMLLLETAYAEFLDREISSMEAENRRLENLVMEYLRILERLEHCKSQNGLLHRKAERLLRKAKKQSRIIREKDLIIKARESEILRSSDALERRSNVIKRLEDEVMELQSVRDQLQEQKNDLLNKLNLIESSTSSASKTDAEGVTMEDYKQLENEYEQLQKERAADIKELIYLRWINACLRHELIRNHSQREYSQEKIDNLEQELDQELIGGGIELGDFFIEHQLEGLELGRGESSFGTMPNHPVCSKRRKLLQKFKRWVEGTEKTKSKLGEKEKHEIKCLARHSVSDEVEKEHLVYTRKSCSSA